MAVQEMRENEYLVTCDNCGTQVYYGTGDEKIMYADLDKTGWKVCPEITLCPECAKHYIPEQEHPHIIPR